MAQLDNYLPCEAYTAAPASEKHPGFNAWYDADNAHHYFAVTTNTGRVVLRSEGYTTEAARDNGIESVLKNRDLEERYAVIQDESDGQWYVILKAGNYQEIARSCAYNTETAAQEGIKASFSTFTERTVSNKIIDNYLPCEAYTAAPASDKFPGFNAWYDADNAHHYFAVTTNSGRVVLRSEGYTTEAARDNGIESVLKNRDLEERYAVIQDESDGQWYVILKAGNHQEIARSCAYDTETAAQDGIKASFSTFTERTVSNKIIDNYLPCEAYTAAPASDKFPGFNAWYDADNAHHYFAVTTDSGRVVLRSEGYTTEAARDNGIESVLKNRDLEERYAVIQDETDGQWYVILKAGNHQEIARSCAYDTQAAAQDGIKMSFSTYSERSAGRPVVEDYLACEAYGGQTTTAYPDFTGFTDADSNLHFFAMVDPKGTVLLRSEGYTTESGRSNGIESVIKNRDTEARYKVIRDDAGDWVVSLRAGNNQEIARSCPQPDEAAALAALQLCLGASAAGRAVEAPATIIEDYLPCEAYGSKDASTFEGFTAFQEETSGLHYFAMVDHNNHVVLKSEGYTTATSRDHGIESVIRNRDIEDHWSRQQDDHGYYMSLKAGNHQEIARTCHFESEGALLGWWMPFTSALAFGRIDAEKSPVVSPIEAVSNDAPGAAALTAAALLVPDPEPIILAKKEAPAPVVVNTKAAPIAPVTPIVATSNMEAAGAAAGGGSDWWKWLLGLLLLAALLFLLLRGCDGCNKPVAPTPAVTAPAPPVLDTMKKAAVIPAPTATAPICNCTGHSDPLFNLDASATPKVLHHLGSNPEFGNSHDLSPTQFFQKLQSRAAANSIDKQFLDRVYKGMGYAEGFAAAKADQFSAVELQPGTVGNIGYSKQHKTLYAQLDTEGKDLLAFRIKAANGCDFHFMKTCGNHFFFCQQ